VSAGKIATQDDNARRQRKTAVWTAPRDGSVEDLTTIAP